MKFHLILVCLTLLVAVPAVAQEPTLDEESKERLEWLEKFVGEWKVDHSGQMGDDPTEIEGDGTMTCTMLGQHWLLNDMNMEVMGTAVRGLQTIGYDSKKKKYIGTWVDSMNSFLWHYEEGEVDESSNKLILYAEGPSMTDPSKMARFRDAYEFKTDDHIIATSSVQNEDGKWTTFMTGNAYRVKKDQ